MGINDLTNILPKCLLRGCFRRRANLSKYRGLCLPCYGSAKKVVDTGKSTWEELEEMGLVLPEQDPFTAELERLLHEGESENAGDK